MKKFLSLAVAAAVTVTLFTACGGSGGDANNAPAAGGNDTAKTESEAPAGDVTLNMLSHTYGSLEYFADQMVTKAPEGVTVVPEMTDYSSWQEKMRLNLSSGSDAYDITYITPSDLGEFASNGWLTPLDEYIEKYNDVYDFDDIPDYLWDAYSYDGHIYGIPSHQWAMDLCYRSDLLEEAGIEVPKTLDDLVNATEALTTGGRNGLTLTLQASDMLMVTYQSFLTACGGWFWDDNFNPTFSSEESLRAIDYLQKLYKYLPTDSISYGNNEAAVAVAQDLVAMAMMQTTRTAAMNDPEQSSVAGKMDFAMAPIDSTGKKSAAIWNTAGYSICASSVNNPETIFLTIANSVDKESEAGSVTTGMPIRESSLTDELLAERSDFAAAWAAIQGGATLRPAIPEFAEIMDVSMTALSKVLIGEVDAKTAMAGVDESVKEIFEDAGYY